MGNIYTTIDQKELRSQSILFKNGKVIVDLLDEILFTNYGMIIVERHLLQID